MRENFTSGSVRGLIVTSEPLLQQEVGYELYSTVNETKLEGDVPKSPSHPPPAMKAAKS